MGRSNPRHSRGRPMLSLCQVAGGICCSCEVVMCQHISTPHVKWPKNLGALAKQTSQNIRRSLIDPRQHGQTCRAFECTGALDTLPDACSFILAQCYTPCGERTYSFSPTPAHTLPSKLVLASCVEYSSPDVRSFRHLRPANPCSVGPQL